MDETQRIIGRLEATVDILQAETAGVRSELTAIRLLLAQQRGGWKVIGMMLMASGSVGATITWFFTHFKWGTP